MGDIASTLFKFGIEAWNYLIAFSVDLLKMTPEEYNEGAWEIIESLNSMIFVPVGCGLIVLFFLWGFFSETVDIHREMRDESIIKMLIKLSVAEGLVTYSINIVKAIFGVGANLVLAILTMFGLGDVMQISTNKGTISSACETMSDADIFEGLGYIMITLLCATIIVVMAVKIFVTVVMRFAKIMCIIPYGCFAFAQTAGGQNNGNRGAFVKVIIECALEASYILIALLVTSKFFDGDGLGLLKIFNVQSPYDMMDILFILLELVIKSVLTVGIISTGRELLRRALAL